MTKTRIPIGKLQRRLLDGLKRCLQLVAGGGNVECWVSNCVAPQPRLDRRLRSSSRRQSIPLRLYIFSDKDRRSDKAYRRIAKKKKGRAAQLGGPARLKLWIEMLPS